MTIRGDVESSRDPDTPEDIDQPGLSELREAAVNRPLRRGTLRDDAVAGLNAAITSVPDGMASGLLAGVSPIHGLYAAMAGPIAGGLLSSTQLMIVTTTSAAALGAGQVVTGLPEGERGPALFAMVFLVGILLMVFGLLRLGQLTRFVSYSVMTGFISGIAVLTILTQLPTIAGYKPEGGSRVAQSIDIFMHLPDLNWPSVGTAALALALAVLLPRTRLGNFGTLVAILVASLLVLLPGLQSVQLVKDVGDIPFGIPLPQLPSLDAFSLEVVTGALALSIVIAVQGAGVSQSIPNPDGAQRRLSRDFVAQGAANLTSGLFRGLPIGGSLSTTALSVLAGARSRWAAVFAGLWMVAIVLVGSVPVSYVAMPALAALLIYASARTIRPRDIVAVLRVGWPSTIACVTTFLCTLFLPIQAAVGIGVALSALLFVFSAAGDVSVVEIHEREDGSLVERAPPRQLVGGELVVLDVYGSLFFAGARTLQRMLPMVGNATRPVVVLRMRGRTYLGATLTDVLARYAAALDQVGGRFYLTGVGQGIFAEVQRTKKFDLNGPIRLYEASDAIGSSTRAAISDAQGWLVGMASTPAPEQGST